MTRSILYLSLFVPLLGTAPGPERHPGAPLSGADRGTVRIETAVDTFEVSVEIARSAADRSRGLMGREELGAEEGMYFVFDRDRSGNAGFYMFNTLIPLDIAYGDAEGRIVAIRTMEPCTSRSSGSCPEYPPGAPYRIALEVNAGYFAARDIKEGDRMILVETPEPSAPPPSF